jgi:hypothetical protein
VQGRLAAIGVALERIGGQMAKLRADLDRIAVERDELVRRIQHHET